MKNEKILKHIISLKLILLLKLIATYQFSHEFKLFGVWTNLDKLKLKTNLDLKKIKKDFPLPHILQDNVEFDFVILLEV